MKTPQMLIVEDDPALLRGLVDKFGQEGFGVRVACDGNSAVDLAMDEVPDVVLLDIMLPGLNGFEVCRTLREDAQLDMPILMLTARGRESDIVRGLNLGADDYITKPFSIHELLARVAAAMRRHRGPGVCMGNGVYRFGDCVFDVAARCLTKDGLECALSPQECALLGYFAARPHRALTRAMLLRASSKRSIMTTERSVDRCVKNLRSKIGDDARQPRHVITVREIGYRFEP